MAACQCHRITLILSRRSLSGDEAPAGGRIEHPQAQAPVPVASAETAQAVSPPRGEVFSPHDLAIANDCHGKPWRTRAWSQNVPNRDCTNDGECGDGFCDRAGRCAAIWTCGQDRYGQRCIHREPPPLEGYLLRHCNGICIDGRCRSCESDAECANYRRSGLLCNRARDPSGGRTCVGPPFKQDRIVDAAPPSQ